MAGRPLNLSMIITADAKGVSPATAETRREIASVGEAAKQTAASTQKLTVANDQAAAAAKRAIQATRGQSAAERDLRASIERRLSIGRNAGRAGDPFGGDAARSADVRAYGMELDRLRMKFNPLFGELQRYKMSLSEIRQAHAVGAISAGEMTAAINRERTATLASIAAIKGRRSAMGSLRGSNVNQFNTANIAAQFQDIGVTTAMGMSPLQIALQQGTQLSAVLGPMGAAGAAKSLAAGLASVVSPVSLITIGVVALTAATAQYIFSASDVRSVDDILSEHEEHIRRLGPAYEAAIASATSFVSQSADVVDALFAGDLEKATETLSRKVQAALGKINAEIVSEASSFGAAAGLVGSRFDPFKDLIELLRNGKIDVLAFVEAVRQAELEKPEYASVAQELRQFTDEAAEAAIALTGVAGEVDRAALNFAKAQEEIAKLNPHDLAGRLSELEKETGRLRKEALSGELSVKALGEAIASMSRLNPDLSPAINEIGRLIEAAIQAQNAVSGIANTTPKTSRIGSLDALQADFKDQFNLALRMGDLREQLGGPVKPRSSGGASRAANPYRNVIKSANDRIAQLRTEISLVGKSASEAEKLRFEHQLLARATDNGRQINEQQRQQIRGLSEEYGALSKSLSDAQNAQDKINSRIAKTTALSRDLSGDALRGVRDALADGKIEWQEFAEIGVAAIQRLSDHLIDDLLDSMFQVQSAGSGSGGGGFLSNLFGGFFGGGGFLAGLFHEGRYPGQPGSVRPANPEWFVGAPRYHSGRIPSLAADEQPAILRKNEPVFRSMEHARQVVGNDNQPSRPQVIILRVVAEEGPMLRPTIQAEGQNAAIKVVTEYDKKLTRTFGGRMANAQGRQL